MRSPLRLAVGATVGLVCGLLGLPVLAAAGDRPAPDHIATAGTVPARALSAYRHAAPTCPGLRWQLLAGIGHIESAHGTTGGARLDEHTGVTAPGIFGPPLDGRAGTERHAIGDWLGWWGLPGPWEQAVGPMQLRPATFTAHAASGDDDIIANPHDLDDAATTAARYLCAAAGGRIADERASLLTYNHSQTYVDAVLDYADALTDLPTPAGRCPVAGPTTFTDTWGAPRPGGRTHQGVDMFAAHGTPVVAPVGGIVEHFWNHTGGHSFRLWGDNGDYYYGTHLSAYGDHQGHQPAGTILGYVGQSGNAAGTPPHLHFEVHPGRGRGDLPSPVNPTPTVETWCTDDRTGILLGGGD